MAAATSAIPAGPPSPPQSALFTAPGRPRPLARRLAIHNRVVASLRDFFGRRGFHEIPVTAMADHPARIQLEGMIAPIGDALIAHAKLKPGERVIDVGCGGGPTTLTIAERVSPGGLALGLDVSPMLIEKAQARANALTRAPDAAALSFILDDAATATPAAAPFDVLFSRFGVMFFDDPYPAFAHMRTWLKPDGRTEFACWASIDENPWIKEIGAIIAKYIETPPPDPTAPGPLALADQDRTRDILQTAGFADPAFTLHRDVQLMGGPGASPAEAAAFTMSGMHVGQALAEESDAVKAQVEADLVALYEGCVTPRGVALPSAAWFVTAQNRG